MKPAEAAPSPLLLAWLPALREAAGGGPVLDLACGAGRNALCLADAGVPVIGMDRDRAALERLRMAGRSRQAPVACVRTDLERPDGIPVRSGCCGAILVFRFLYRPLAPAIAAALRPGGLLVYETFTLHQRNLSQGPKNPAFLLRTGELRKLFVGLELLAYEERIEWDPWPQALARLVARRPSAERP